MSRVVLKSRDVEDAIRLDLSDIMAGLKYSIIAPPIPAALERSLPLIVVTRLGGMRSEIVVEEHDVAIDVYASRWSTAQDVANTTAAALSSLADSAGLSSGVDWLDASLNALPYNNPDPAHEDVPRVSFSAVVTCRPEAIDL